MPQAMPLHQRRALIDGVAQGHVAHIHGHDVLDLRVPRRPAEPFNFSGTVALTDDSGQTVPIAHHQRTNILLRELLQSGKDTLIRSDPEHVTPAAEQLGNRLPGFVHALNSSWPVL